MLRYLLYLCLIFFCFINELHANNDVLLKAFLQLSENQSGNLNEEEKTKLIKFLDQPSYLNDANSPWLSKQNNLLTLYNAAQKPISYKLFKFSNNHKYLLTVCHNRKFSNLNNPSCIYDVCFFIFDGNKIQEVKNIDTILPKITILDFSTADIYQDSRNLNQMENLNQSFQECLSCNLGANETNNLEIISIGSLYGIACSGFLTQYGIIPLNWDGQKFLKHY